ncbi:MAG: helix-turn-helix domain-containing protein [Spirochaetes bacterium]|nr:helix-turn-helix domain-containing protein [Spirochaetota bacterium]
MTGLVSISELCQLLGLSRSTLYRLIAKREIAVVRLGGRLRFEMSDVETFISRHKTPQALAG